MMRVVSIAFGLFGLLACSQEDTVQVHPHSEAQLVDPEQVRLIDTLVAAIAKENRVDSRAVGYAGVRSAQYDRFVALSGLPVAYLRQLTRHDNLAVRCYAGWALAEKEYSGLDSVLVEFLEEKEMVKTQRGCIGGHDPLASELYHAYWNQLRHQMRSVPEKGAEDHMMFKMDSIVIYREDAYGELLDRALGNRIYPSHFNERIATLAFHEKNLDAVYYLFRNKRDSYGKEIRSALRNHLRKAELWPSEYLKVATMILGIDDRELKEDLLKRMRTKGNWRYSQDEFQVLFEHHGLILPPTED